MSPIIPTDIPENNCGNNSADDDTNNVINVLSDSDSVSEDDYPSYEGYEPLSQDPESFIDNQCSLGEDNNFLADQEPQAIEVTLINHQSLLLPAPTVLGLETGCCASAEEFKMDEKHIETIKSVMKNITLPTSNLPQWASLVPEEEWKNALFSEMILKKTSDNKKKVTKDSLNNCSDFQNDIPR